MIVANWMHSNCILYSLWMVHYFWQPNNVILYVYLTNTIFSKCHNELSRNDTKWSIFTMRYSKNLWISRWKFRGIHPVFMYLHLRPYSFILRSYWLASTVIKNICKYLASYGLTLDTRNISKTLHYITQNNIHHSIT